MNHRFVELLGLTALADEDITEVDLDMADPISELILDLRVTQGAAADSTEHNILCFKKIEITDGSDVLFSLDGPEMAALDIYHSGMHPRGGWFHYLPGLVSDAQVAISFGRYLWDEELAFDPKKFSNPKLKVTFDKDLGGNDVSAGQISVLAALFDEKVISPTGFLMTKEIKRWTKAATGHEYTDMPTDYPYRKILLQGRYAGTSPHSVLAHIKLASDQDKKVILNNEFRDLIFSIARENAFVREIITTQGGVRINTAHSTPTMDVKGNANQWISGEIGGSIATYAGSGGEYQFYCEYAQNTVHHVSGWAPHGTLAIPLGKQDVIADWFDVMGIGSLKLDITSGNGSAVQKLFIQQYRTY